MTVPKRIASNLINALKGGVVPRTGLGYIAVGRTAEINALLHDVEIAEQGGAFFRFVVGRYGSGKSFLLQTMRSYVMDKGFVVVDADLSPERRLMGSKGQGLATYRELMRNMSVKTKPDGGALQLILDKWLTGLRAELIAEGGDPDSITFDVDMKRRMRLKTAPLCELVHGYDFEKVLTEYYDGFMLGMEHKTAAAVRWLRGEYANKTEARQELSVNSVIGDDNWYDYVKLMTAFLTSAGYKGLVLMIDELVNIMKIPHSVTRQNNYEKMLTMYNDALQGRTPHLGIIMGGTPQAVEDPRRGVFSYEALRSRLERGRFATDDTHDMLAPIIKLQPLTYEELTVLTEKLTDIHAGLYGYESRITLEDRIYFIKAEFSRVGADKNITPREMIRDFIELLNMAYQNPERSLPELMGDEGFAFSESDEKPDTDGFEDFDL